MRREHEGNSQPFGKFLQDGESRANWGKRQKPIIGKISLELEYAVKMTNNKRGSSQRIETVIIILARQLRERIKPLTEKGGVGDAKTLAKENACWRNRA